VALFTALSYHFGNNDWYIHLQLIHFIVNKMFIYLFIIKNI